MVAFGGSVIETEAIHQEPFLQLIAEWNLSGRWVSEPSKPGSFPQLRAVSLALNPTCLGSINLSYSKYIPKMEIWAKKHRKHEGSMPLREI